MSGKDGGWLLPETVDPPRKSFCIEIPNEPRHVQAFFGALQALANWWNWQQDAEHTATLVAQVWRVVANNAHTAFYEEECQMYLLRQNPDDMCQLEQSVDGGDNWTLAFDFGLCIPPATQTILDQVGTLYNNAWQPSPYAPIDTWVHTDGDTVTRSDQRAAALCYAAHQVVGLICDTLVGAYQGTYTLVTIAQAATALLAPFAIILGGAVFGGMAVAICEIALAVVQDMIGDDITILQDADIRETLACVLFEQMSSRPVTAESFATAFQDDFSCFTASEQRAMELFDRVLGNQEALEQYFIGFSDIVAQSLLAESAALLPTCSCVTGSWTYCLPLDKWWTWSESISPVVYNCTGGTDSLNDGSHLEEISGDPAWAAGEQSGFLTLERHFRIYVPSGTTVTSVGFARDWFAGSGNSDDWYKRITVNGDCITYTTFAPAYITRDSLSISGEDLLVEIAMQNSGGTTNVLAVNSIKLTGTGVPLFGGCNC